jgi:hypothetical protein
MIRAKRFLLLLACAVLCGCGGSPSAQRQEDIEKIRQSVTPETKFSMDGGETPSPGAESKAP